MSLARKKIILFLILTFSFSGVFYYLMASAGEIGSYTLGLMWCPGIAALLTQFAFQRNVRGLGWGTGRPKYLLLSYGLPVIYGVVIYGVVWLTGLGKFSPDEIAQQVAAQFQFEVSSPIVVVVLYTLVMATIGILLSGLTALGEEIGWRGLLVPELAKETSFTKTALFSGIIWAAWHFPVILFADYNAAGIPAWYSLTNFFVAVVGLSFAFAWLRLKSGSLWTAALLHASHNLFIQNIFTPLTADTGITAYIIDEFGIGLALAGVAIAWIFWRKRGELPAVAS
jgi:membrane protease YdiL (CAAX protease family)